MFKTKQFFSTLNDSSRAAQEIIEEIKQPDIKMVLFFASSKYDFEVVTHAFNDAFPDAEVVGCISQGEIGTNHAYSDGSLIALSIASDEIETASVLIKEVKTKTMLAKKNILKALDQLHLSLDDRQLSKKCFCFSFIDGFSESEEKVMTLTKFVFKNNLIPIVGGSYGDLFTQKSFVSLNGEIYNNAAVLIFIKTSLPFMVYRENIYQPVGEPMRVTKADMVKRVVYELNGKPIQDVYANFFNISKEQLDDTLFARHPLGKNIKDDILITSPHYKIGTTDIKFYAQLLNGTKVSFMEPIDVMETTKETKELIKKTLNHPKVIIGFNCILRYLQFQNEKCCELAYKELNQVAPYFGFTTLGEQYNHMQVNQTLTFIAIGE